MTPANWGIIIASGRGEKFSPDVDTAFLNLGSKPILTYSLSAFETCPDIDAIVLVGPKDRLENIRIMVQMFGCFKVKRIVAGAAHPQASILNALKAIEEEKPGVITIHEGSRPCITSAQISETVKAAKKHGAAVLASILEGAVRETDKKGKVVESLSDRSLCLSRTPQSFQANLLAKAMAAAQKKKSVLTDYAEAMSLIKQPIQVVTTEQKDIRIKEPNDLILAETILKH